MLTGRILNCFSRDTEIMDSQLPIDMQLVLGVWKQILIMSDTFTEKMLEIAINIC